MNPYPGGYVAPSVPSNQVASVPAGWIDIPGCYLGPPEYYTGCPAPQAAPVAPAPVLPPLPALTPDNILQPMPDITLATQAIPLPLECSVWSKVNHWIGENPVIAVVILAGVALVGWSKKR